MRWILLVLLCSACRGKPPVPILNYHSVGATADDYTVTEAQFAQQLDWLQSAGIETLPLHDALTPHARAVVLTFDDGKEDALTRVLPALRRRGMRAAFFIPTRFFRVAHQHCARSQRTERITALDAGLGVLEEFRQNPHRAPSTCPGAVATL